MEGLMSDYKGTEQDDVIDAKALDLAPWTPIYGLGGNDKISAASTVVNSAFCGITVTP